MRLGPQATNALTHADVVRVMELLAKYHVLDLPCTCADCIYEVAVDVAEELTGYLEVVTA